MRITSTQLRQIIREELTKSINEGFFDSAKRALGFGPTYEEAREAAIQALKDEGGGKILHPPGDPLAGLPVMPGNSYVTGRIIDNKIKEMYPDDIERFFGPDASGEASLAGAPARAETARNANRRLTRAASGVYFK